MISYYFHVAMYILRKLPIVGSLLREFRGNSGSYNWNWPVPEQFRKKYTLRETQEKYTAGVERAGPLISIRGNRVHSMLVTPLFCFKQKRNMSFLSSFLSSTLPVLFVILLSLLLSYSNNIRPGLQWMKNRQLLFPKINTMLFFSVWPAFELAGLLAFKGENLLMKKTIQVLRSYWFF